MSKMSSHNSKVTAFQKFERNLHYHACTQIPEENWWPSNATAYQPIPTLPNPPNDDRQPIRPCNIHLRCLLIQEQQKDFSQLNPRDQTLTMKIFFEEHSHLMTRKTLFKPITSSSSVQLFEPIEVIHFQMQKISSSKIIILQQLLKKELIFNA
jgi:hypothetical protein